MCVTGTSLAYYLSHGTDKNDLDFSFEKARSDMLTACFLLGIAPAERSGRGEGGNAKRGRAFQARIQRVGCEEAC